MVRAAVVHGAAVTPDMLRFAVGSLADRTKPGLMVEAAVIFNAYSTVNMLRLTVYAAADSAGIGLLCRGGMVHAAVVHAAAVTPDVLRFAAGPTADVT